VFRRKELGEADVVALVDAIRRDTLDEPGAAAEVDHLLRRVSSSGLRGLATVKGGRFGLKTERSTRMTTTSPSSTKAPIDGRS